MSEVFATLKSSITPNRKDILMFDAMAIKKAYQYDTGSKTYYGHIQCGCEETLASEILVFMIVGLKEHFKQVIGYFLIDKINAQTQAQLDRDAMNLHTVRLRDTDSAANPAQFLDLSWLTFYLS